MIIRHSSKLLNYHLELREEIKLWLKDQNILYHYDVDYDVEPSFYMVTFSILSFFDEKDEVLFKLRWM
jgi:hypothetical protein